MLFSGKLREQGSVVPSDEKAFVAAMAVQMERDVEVKCQETIGAIEALILPKLSQRKKTVAPLTLYGTRKTPLGFVFVNLHTFIFVCLCVCLSVCSRGDCYRYLAEQKGDKDPTYVQLSRLSKASYADAQAIARSEVRTLDLSVRMCVVNGLV